MMTTEQKPDDEITVKELMELVKAARVSVLLDTCSGKFNSHSKSFNTVAELVAFVRDRSKPPHPETVDVPWEFVADCARSGNGSWQVAGFVGFCQSQVEKYRKE